MMAYRKVCDAHAGGLVVSEGLQCSGGGLELDWELDKDELQEAGGQPHCRDHVQLQHQGRHRTTGCSDTDPDPEMMEHIQSSVSVSPHGRFERLQEDPNYISHFTRSPAGHMKGQSRLLHCFLLRHLLAGTGLFILGLVIGWFAHTTPAAESRDPPTDSSDLLEELLRGITADKIETLQRSFDRLSYDGEEARARYLYRQWAGLGLSDVRLSNHTVLLSLPGPAPNNITDALSGQCFLSDGMPCGQQTADLHSSYAAYSAVGSLQAEVVDVQYGSVGDLRRAAESTNLTGQIALVKLGQAPLLYKLSLLSEVGFGGVLLYVDPCDSPAGRRVWRKSFRVTLNPGGDPSTPGYPSLVALSREDDAVLTSMLVQPISAFLAQRLLSSPSTGQAEACAPLAMPPNAERKKITLSVGNRSAYKKIYNVVGYLRGKYNPDRYVLVGSRHDSDQGGAASAIMTQLIATATEQTKRGWAPDRTTVFCSWGGSAFGNIGSYEWGEDNSVVLQSSAVAYVSLNSPVRGTETLRATASPSLLQLTSDIQKRQLLSCIRGGNCPGPNVSSLQLPGDVSFFANQLAVPTLEFAFEQSKAEETTSFLSEAEFPAESPETVDPLFKFHETIAKMTAEAILRLINDPVLPFYPLDIALDVQNKLRGSSVAYPALLSSAASLRDRAAFLQSESMRPANDPKERERSHVRMLNDVLRDLEKSFLVPLPPPGVYRNLLYSLPGKTPQFSILRFSEMVPQPTTTREANQLQINSNRDVLHHSSVNQSLSLILRAIGSAEKLVNFGLDLFENYPGGAK